ncbi:hypothetical protein DFH06DRAFT_602543 [Mycena polygramma]|nr:hypothetical protein DFH06DRAFT_602543 [Mycena polygramma]
MRVAIAGASSGVGRCIAESILRDTPQTGHTLIVLSRTPDSLELAALSALGATITAVSYDSQESLIAALKGVHTVISAIGDHARSASAQLALVQAAVDAKVTRFVPSGWSGTDGGPEDVVALYRFKQPVLDALRASGMQWSHPENGVFLNYLASGSPKKGGNASLKELKFFIDVENCTATIPGDGNMKIAYTAVEDVGAFVAKALCVEGPWPETLRIVGARVTHNELVKIVEEVRGNPITVTYQSRADLTAALVPNPPSLYVNMATQLSLALLDGRFSFEGNFNDKVQHDFIQPAEFVRKWWGAEE